MTAVNGATFLIVGMLIGIGASSVGNLKSKRPGIVAAILLFAFFILGFLVGGGLS
jgi:hypothetical protein